MPTAPVRRLDKNHDMTFGAGARNFATLAEATMQRVRCECLLVLGEWFLDTTAGVPWFQPDDGTAAAQPIMGGPANLAYAQAVLKAKILSIDGVASILSFSMNFDHVSRRSFASGSGTTVDGEVFSFKLQDPGP